MLVGKLICFPSSQMLPVVEVVLRSVTQVSVHLSTLACVQQQQLSTTIISLVCVTLKLILLVHQCVNVCLMEKKNYIACKTLD